MSRIGKKIATIPQGTEVTVADGVLTVKGKGGELKKNIHPLVTITVENGTVAVNPVDESREARALWGTFSSHVHNMITGVNTPFEKTLVVEGIGFKVALQGKTLVLNVGFSHPVEMEVPDGVTVEVEKNNIKISSIDKEALGQFAANVRAVKKPEPYKGKGIRYSDEVIRRKEGKRVA